MQFDFMQIFFVQKNRRTLTKKHLLLFNYYIFFLNAQNLLMTKFSGTLMTRLISGAMYLDMHTISIQNQERRLLKTIPVNPYAAYVRSNICKILFAEDFSVLNTNLEFQ